MRLLTWNIQWGRGLDGRVDLVRIAREIEAHAPDVVCLQEVVRGIPELTQGGVTADDQPAVLADLFTGWSSAYAPALDVAQRAGTRRQFGNMLLTRLPLLEVRRHALPMPADASVPAMPRAALECTVMAPWGPLVVVTTHLAYYSVHQRLAQVAALRRLLAENVAHALAPRPSGGEGEPHFAAMPRSAGMVLCGDFNCPPDSPELMALQVPLSVDEMLAAGASAVPPLRPRAAEGDPPQAGAQRPRAGCVVAPEADGVPTAVPPLQPRVAEGDPPQAGAQSPRAGCVVAPEADGVPTAVPPRLCFEDAWRRVHGAQAHVPTAGRVASADFPAPVCFDFAFVSTPLACRLQTIRVDAATSASDHQPVTVDFADSHES